MSAASWSQSPTQQLWGWGTKLGRTRNRGSQHFCPEQAWITMYTHTQELARWQIVWHTLSLFPNTHTHFLTTHHHCTGSGGCVSLRRHQTFSAFSAVYSCSGCIRGHWEHSQYNSGYFKMWAMVSIGYDNVVLDEIWQHTDIPTEEASWSGYTTGPHFTFRCFMKLN